MGVKMPEVISIHSSSSFNSNIITISGLNVAVSKYAHIEQIAEIVGKEVAQYVKTTLVAQGYKPSKDLSLSGYLGGPDAFENAKQEIFNVYQQYQEQQYQKSLFEKPMPTKQADNKLVLDSQVGSDLVLEPLAKAIPALKTFNIDKCPAVDCGWFIAEVPLSSTIIHLNDYHCWTRQRIAEWLKTLPCDLTFKEIKDNE